MALPTSSRRCLRTLKAEMVDYRPSSNPTSAAYRSKLQQQRSFAITSSQRSNIGGAPLTIPPSVQFSIIPPVLGKDGVRVLGQQQSTPVAVIKGPLGELRMPMPDYIQIDHDEPARKATVRVIDPNDKKQRSMWGTTRAYLNNHILGVSEGHTTLLRMVGVGYRATVEKTASTVEPTYPGQQFVSLKVGYSHPIELGIPQGVKASTPQPTRILLEGHEKEVIKSFAAKIRKWRVPEPYKGKGIFVDDETIRLKAKKIK